MCVCFFFIPCILLCMRLQSIQKPITLARSMLWSLFMLLLRMFAKVAHTQAYRVAQTIKWMCVQYTSLQSIFLLLLVFIETKKTHTKCIKRICVHRLLHVFRSFSLFKSNAAAAARMVWSGCCSIWSSLLCIGFCFLLWPSLSHRDAQSDRRCPTNIKNNLNKSAELRSH